MVREETEGSSRSITGSEPGVTGRVLGVFFVGWFTWYQGCRWQSAPVSKGENNLCTGVSRGYEKSFQLNLQGEGDKSRLTNHNPGDNTPAFEGQCACKVLWSAISVEAENGDPSSSKDLRLIDVLEIVEVPENFLVEIKDASPQKVARSIAQFQCIYSNVHNMGNTQKEWEATVQ